MKVAPLIRILRSAPVTTRNGTEISYQLVHTGQHYDAAMSDVFFAELGIPAPDINLEAGSGSHSVQTATIIERFDSVCERERPDWVVVVGDVNSTMACTVVCAKRCIPVAHVEAGLRSFDRTMPEEVNRLVTDTLADLLLTPSRDAGENLLREGAAPGKIRFVGNIMIDSLVANLPKARERKILPALGLTNEGYVYVTLHRPSNVDDATSLRAIVGELLWLSRKLPVVFPIHPRTRKMLGEFGILASAPGLKIIEPIGYHDSLALTEHARFVLTDSGGLQEESTFFRTPCLTLRPNTERPVTVTLGSNRLVSLADLRAAIEETLSGATRKGSVPPLWDGRTAERVLHEIATAWEG